jgi:hypothetical protein
MPIEYAPRGVSAPGGTVPVSSGGTGATTVPAALTNLGIQRAVLLADSPNIISNTTLTADPTLKFSCGANEVWCFIAGLRVLADTNTPGIKLGLVSTQPVTSIGSGTARTFDSSGILITDYFLALGNNSSVSGVNFLIGEFIGSLQMGGTAGVVSVGVAQNTSSTDAIRLKQNSFILAIRIS